MDASGDMWWGVGGINDFGFSAAGEDEAFGGLFVDDFLLYGREPRFDD